MYWEYYLMGIILLPAVLIALVAQIKVNTTYNKYNEIPARCGLTARELMQRLVSAAGMHDVKITQTSGTLSDHYDPRTKTLALSSEVYNSTSISALGIACHEFGHALQHQKNYAPLKIRLVLIPITNIVSNLLWPLVIVGLILNLGAGEGLIGNIFLWSGVAVFGGSVLVNLITLPVEFNASNRAIVLLRETGALEQDELVGAKKVLSAAASTYVAALLVSLLNLLRFVLVILKYRDRD